MSASSPGLFQLSVKRQRRPRVRKRKLKTVSTEISRAPALPASPDAFSRSERSLEPATKPKYQDFQERTTSYNLVTNRFDGRQLRCGGSLPPLDSVLAPSSQASAKLADFAAASRAQISPACTDLSGALAQAHANSCFHPLPASISACASSYYQQMSMSGSEPLAIVMQQLVCSALVAQRIVAIYRTLSGQAQCSFDVFRQVTVSANAEDKPSVSHQLLAPPTAPLLFSVRPISHYQPEPASAHLSVRADPATGSFFEPSASFSVPSRIICPFFTTKPAQGRRLSRSFDPFCRDSSAQQATPSSLPNSHPSSSLRSASHYQPAPASACTSVRASTDLSSSSEPSALFSIPSRIICPFFTRTNSAQGGRSSRSFVSICDSSAPQANPSFLPNSHPSSSLSASALQSPQTSSLAQQQVKHVEPSARFTPAPSASSRPGCALSCHQEKRGQLNSD